MYTSTLKTILLLVLVVTSTAASAEEISITVKGMVCSFCAQGIKKAFGKVPSVEKVDADLENKIINVITKKEETVSDSDINKIINDAGYDVVKIERSGK